MSTRALTSATWTLVGLLLAVCLVGCHDDGTVAAVADTVETDIFVPDAAADTAVDSGEEVFVEPGCSPDQCDIDARCFDNGVGHPDDPCLVCVVYATTAEWTPNDAAPCDDGDACTRDDHCRDGLCAGAAVDCDDDNLCTTDSCDEDDGACVHVASKDLDPSCEDPCLADPAPDCEDDNPCTEDRCEPFVGCVNERVDDHDALACDDGNSCTADDVCVEGECLGAALLDCDDGDLCTIDVCDADNGCVHTSIASLCTDENPCTDERCDPALGCVFPFNTDPCDDQNACTALDTCDGGACLGKTVNPDDANPCTDDLCDPLLGVINAPNTLTCDDGNACTVGDVCAGGACTQGPDPLACDDENICTDDSCDPLQGCVNDTNRIACNDDNACTRNDRCADGVCDGATVNCDDDNACTADSCNVASGCVNDLILVNSCRPNFVIDYPGRGETVHGFTGVRFINVRGSVNSGAGPITSLTVNGETPTSYDPVTGEFTHLLGVDVGGNILIIEATDSFGTERRRVSSFLWSSNYRKPTTPMTGVVTHGVGVWLDKDAIDDGNRSLPPNDLGTIFELAIGGLDIAGLLPSPAASNQNAGYGIGRYTVYLENFRYDAPRVTLTPRSGGLRVRAELRNGRVDIRAVRTGCEGPFGVCVGPGTVRGDIRFSSIVILADINLSVAADHTIRATVPSSTVAINGVSLNIDGILGGILEFIIETFILDGLVDDIESEFNQQIAPLLEPLMEDALAALAFGFDFAVPSFSGGADVPVEVVTDFQAIQFDADGGEIRLRAGAYAESVQTPYTNRGIPDRVNCGTGTQSLTIPEARILELVLADDTLNQILYAAWRGGLLEFPVPAAWLQGADLSEFGISDLDLTVSGLLAPTASDCAGPGGLKAHIGDLKIDASLSLFGTPLDVDVWVSLVANIDIAEVDGQLTVAIDAIDRVETEVVVEQPNLIAAEGAIKDLIEEQLLGGLLDTIGGQELGAIPLPDIDLSGSIPGLPPGTGIRIEPQAVYRLNGNTVVGGRLN